jgi:TnpA family transposase
MKGRSRPLIALSARTLHSPHYHHGLPLAQEWGAGRLSSSDGQRFAARTRGPGVAALPRYFGHRRRGLQVYSWTSDQYSQYSSKVVTATVRDATHTLDGILGNQTVLPIEEHTTDTHGYTVMWTPYPAVRAHRGRPDPAPRRRR